MLLSNKCHLYGISMDFSILAVHNENLAEVQDEGNIQIIHNLEISK